MEFLLITVGGLLGSAHCVGMCGSFVLAVGATSPHWVANLRRQLTYALGRVCTYACGGMIVGYMGRRVLQEMGAVQPYLAIAAGGLLVVQGLLAAGVLSWRRGSCGGGGCPGASLFSGLLRNTRSYSVFLAGAMNGLLPCGLVYAYLALAASSGSMALGGATMAFFGLGTIPILVVVGCGGGSLRGPWRQRVFRAAAWCIVLTGVLAAGRGVYALANPEDMTVEGFCPLCR